MFNKISSKENVNIKETVKLLKDSNIRKKKELFVIEGFRICLDALLNNVSIKKVFFTEEIYCKHKNDILNIINKSTYSYCVTDKIMSLISDTSTHQGIVCVCKIIKNDFNFNNFNKIVVLENIQNPINLGTILRTCDAMGINAILISENSCDVYNPKVLRGSMGSAFHLPIIKTTNLAESLIKLKNNDFETYAMILDNEAIPINKLTKKDKIAILIGNEGNGLKSETINLCTQKITIPMKGKSESLNAAVAASIAIWEITQDEM